VGTLLGYFIIAIQVFVTYLEFGIVSTLGLILIPFGVLKHTSFLCEKVFGAIISFGVKLMVLGLLVSITVPVLKTFCGSR
jgi:type IV secretion system protein TrbL